MKSKLMTMMLVLVFSVLIIHGPAFAETKTFIKEYTYQASDEDGKNACRVISLGEVKRLLLEELGTYLESETEVKNFQLSRDQITTLTAGIVQTELVEEKWDGRTYWIKAKIKADSNDVVKAIDTMRKDRQKTKELEDIRKKSDALLKENERLRQELARSAKSKGQEKRAKAYKKTINELDAAEWFEKGVAAGTSGNYTVALAAFNKAINLNPQYADAYNGRGVVYGKLGNYKQAIKDFNKAIKLNPQDSKAYHNRGLAYDELGNYKQAINDHNKVVTMNLQDAKAYFYRGLAYSGLGNDKQAIKDYDKAIELNPQYALAYNIRGLTYDDLGNYKQAIDDFDNAIKISPQDAKAYFYRGATYIKLGNYKQAIEDFGKAIDLNPQYAEAYFRRGLTYVIIGNNKQADVDIKIGARLGDKGAQDILRKHGIVW